jgi:hypothetical protein
MNGSFVRNAKNPGQRGKNQKPGRLFVNEVLLTNGRARGRARSRSDRNRRDRALRSTAILGATLVGYDPTGDNIAKLLSLAREEEAAAKAALHPTAHH